MAVRGIVLVGKFIRLDSNHRSNTTPRWLVRVSILGVNECEIYSESSQVGT